MADIITQEDLMLVLSQSSSPKLDLKVEVLDQNLKIVGILHGIVSGSMSIDGQADVRRTASLVLQPTLTEHIKLSETGLIWLNKDIRMSVGLYNARTGQYKYYPLGYYVYTDASGAYDAASNSLTINCADFMKKLDGTKNGQLGTLLISYPAYDEDETTGEPLKYYTVRETIQNALEQLAGITNHRIDDIGDYKAMPEYNDNWETYREENSTRWDKLAFDQEFSSGCSVLSILTALRDLFPNYEMFFDMEYNTFVCQMVPLCYADDLFLDNGFLQRVLISESTSVDMTSVRNICEVWGPIKKPDYYDDNCTYLNNTYSASIKGYGDKYSDGDFIALIIPSPNQAGAKINVNKLGEIGIYDEYDEQPIDAGELTADSTYNFRIQKTNAQGKDVIKAYLLGKQPPHAVNVLTNGRKSGQFVTGPDGEEYELYSKEYFQTLYECERVDMTVIANSPYTVEMLGEIPDVKTGGEYDNITSDDLAAGRARWENWKNSRLTDNITITTALLPFLDVNKKVSYKPCGSDRERQYIISSVSHDFTGFTSTITMYRFYPLYEDLQREAGMHKVLHEFSHGVLSKYAHEELETAVSGDEL